MKMAKIHFYKMHAAGNDFVLVNNTAGLFRGDEAALFRNMCERHTGIGANGVMLLEKNAPAQEMQPQTDFRLKYFNADGLPAEMCGNGARCAVFLAHRLNLTPQRKCVFEMDDKTYRAEIIGKNAVRLQMNPPRILLPFPEAKLLLSDDFNDGLWLDTAVPHFVVEVSKPLQEVEVVKWGRYYRQHQQFQPEGTNVNFVQPAQPNRLRARVYERGVEDETLACGTGAVACAVYAHRKYGWQSPIEIQFPGGILQVEFEEDYQSISLSSTVHEVFEGDFETPDFDSKEVAN